MSTSGDWWVWGNGKDAILESVDYETMKAKVDADTTDTLYGEETVSGDFYEGGEE